MTPSELENLAEAQREAVRALASLTEQFRGETTAAGAVGQQAGANAARAGDPGVERALESISQALGHVGDATSASAQALAGVGKELGGLPSLVAGLLGGVKDGGGGLGSVLKAGLGLPGLISGIVGLFRKGHEQQAPLVPFLEPAKLALEVANTDDILQGFPRADRGQRGEIRVKEPQRPVIVQPQVTVNVSAMDSRSFLDRSEDIARAVREAMLHMHPVNDLISEL